MHRVLTIAALFSIVWFPISLAAQSRGGPRNGSRQVSGTTGKAPSRFVLRQQFRSPVVRTPRVIQPALYYQPFYGGAAYYPGGPAYYPGGPAYYPGPPYFSVQETPKSDSNQVAELAYEVERLTQEIQRLREEQQSRDTQQAPPPSPVSNEKPSAPTILVFRDGHQTQVQGYAIVGQTLWILTEQSSTRVPITDLDLEATQNLNSERGVRFLVPRKP